MITDNWYNCNLKIQKLGSTPRLAANFKKNIAGR